MSTDLEERIRGVLFEEARRAPTPPERWIAREAVRARASGDRLRRWAMAAAALVIVVGVVALIAQARGRTPAVDVTAEPMWQPPGEEFPLSTARGIGPDEWVIVPPGAGLEWRYGFHVDAAAGDWRADRIVYGTSAAGPDALIIHLHRPPLDPGIDSGEWAGYPPIDGWIETRRLGDTEITVQGADGVDRAIVDQLLVVHQTGLPTTPLGQQDRATAAVAATHDSREWIVSIERSGGHQVAYVDVSGTTKTSAVSTEPELRFRLGPIAVEDRSEPTVDYQDQPFAEGAPGEYVAIGRAPADVSSVDVELSNGSTVTAATGSPVPGTTDRYWIAITRVEQDTGTVSVLGLTTG